MNEGHARSPHRIVFRGFRSAASGEADTARPARTVYCVPAAGTGARNFLLPFARSPLRGNLRVVQLPGREDRLNEPCIDDITQMGALIADAIANEGVGDFALYGHSFGALVALETTRMLDRLGAPAPALLAVAACAAPQLPQAVRFDALGPTEIADTLRNLGGLNFSGPLGAEMAAAVLPALTADCRACTRYLDAVGQDAISCPIVAQGGTLDPAVPMERVTAWRDCTTAGFAAQAYPGGHFFPLESDLPIREVVNWQPDQARS
ncbi:thioesterase II family protein [Kitasatospora kifunensis]|uniref:Surfactin synthase thioesterase subunit n=1 Tax=Kitasatospora kifunensis TaxID=58351 RepID=A0A7W7R121_KITKI|nr:alpha/beta fold hydrolase [Kitasatospora kifunensis]MBB4923462.1 surfactin synthase thioesterase subunit [Kitasatospora kifunensis]